jgi:DNA-binding transcriptional regulator YiaG
LIVSNVVNALKQEVLRLAKKEAKAQVGKARKAVSQYRHEIARLKRALAQREREVKYLTKQVQSDEVRSEDAQLVGIRFSARSVRAQRRRLGLSAEDYGRLVGVTALSVLAWEQGRSRPRRAQLAALVAVRGISKKEAMERLAK